MRNQHCSGYSHDHPSPAQRHAHSPAQQLRHKDAIKALASYPDMQWGADAKAWLLDVGLLNKLYETLGDSIAPASPSFWMQCPLPTPIVAHKARRTNARS
jgi:hypothetical protein